MSKYILESLFVPDWVLLSLSLSPSLHSSNSSVWRVRSGPVGKVARRRSRGQSGRGTSLLLKNRSSRSQQTFVQPENSKNDDCQETQSRYLIIYIQDEYIFALCRRSEDIWSSIINICSAIIHVFQHSFSFGIGLNWQVATSVWFGRFLYSLKTSWLLR